VVRGTGSKDEEDPITPRVSDTQNDKDNVMNGDICSSESNYIPSEDGTGDNDEIVTTAKSSSGKKN